MEARALGEPHVRRNMNIQSIGELHKNPHIPQWLDSDEIHIPFLGNQRVVITFQDIVDDPAPQEFEQAINNFLQLTAEDRKETNPYVFGAYKDFVECVGEEEFDFTIEDEDAVWEHIHPTQISVSRRQYGDKAVYVQIATECDWEAEHGLQIVYQQGKELKRVSSQDDHLTNSDAYAKPELENEILARQWS